MCQRWAASPSFGQADPTEDIPGHVPRLSWVIFRSQKKPSCWPHPAGTGGTSGLLERVSSFAWTAVIGGRGFPSSAPDGVSPKPGLTSPWDFCLQLLLHYETNPAQTDGHSFHPNAGASKYHTSPYPSTVRGFSLMFLLYVIDRIYMKIVLQ